MARSELDRVVISLQGEYRASHGLREVLEQASNELRPEGLGGLEEALQRLSAQLEQLRGTSQAQIQATAENTSALIENTAAQSSERRESTAVSVGRAIGKVFTSGLGLSPLISGLARLFGGGREEASAPALVRYVAPPPIYFEGVVGRKTMGGYGSLGLPDEAGATAEGRDWPGGGALRAAAREKFRPIEITVQVQAMDSRSFLEHSEEIARAVREAMLNSHVLNDVVAEL